MKVRIQRSNAGREWHAGFDAEVTERGAQTIRVKVPGSFGYIETLWATGKKAGEQWNNSRSLRVHPEDVSVLASLPVRVAKTKPLDLNAHPMADVLRQACIAAERRAFESAEDAITEIGVEADAYVERDACAAPRLTLLEILTDAIAGLVAAQKGGA